MVNFDFYDENGNKITYCDALENHLSSLKTCEEKLRELKFLELQLRKHQAKNRQLFPDTESDLTMFDKENFISILREEIRNSKEYNSEKQNKTGLKKITPIELNLNQTQIVYLFQSMVDGDIIDESKNPSLFSLVSKYFTAHGGKLIKNHRKIKNNLKNTYSQRPKQKADEIDDLIKSNINKS